MIRRGTIVTYAEYFDSHSVDEACGRSVHLFEVGKVRDLEPSEWADEPKCYLVEWALGGKSWMIEDEIVRAEPSEACEYARQAQQTHDRLNPVQLEMAS